MRQSLLRFALLGIGCLSLALGIVGIFLPLLPTTPFLLLSSACFMRASPKIANWLLAHPHFGPIIENWQKNRAVDRKIKRRATIFIVLSFGVSIALVPELWHKLMLFSMCCVLLIWFNRLREIEPVARTPENT